MCRPEHTPAVVCFGILAMLAGFVLLGFMLTKALDSGFNNLANTMQLGSVVGAAFVFLSSLLIASKCMTL